MKKVGKNVLCTVFLCTVAMILSLGVYAMSYTISLDTDRSLTVMDGDSVTLSVPAGDAEGCVWYNGSDESPIGGANGTSYSFTASSAMNGSSIYCKYTSGGAEMSTGRCNLSVIYLTQDIPDSVSAKTGETITLSAAANGSGLSCQWYTDTGILTGQTSGTLSVPAEASLNGRSIYCQFYGEAGSVSTRLCHVTVTADTPTNSPAPSNTPEPSASPNPPAITKNPTGETVQEHESAIFIAHADNAESCIWRFTSTDNTRTYTYDRIGTAFTGLSVSGGDTDTLTVSNIPYELNGWKVACLFKNAGGETVSSDAIITVQKADSKLRIISQPVGATLALDENMDYVLSVQATATDGGNFKYQWYSCASDNLANMKVISGAVNSSYKPTRTEGTIYYQVEVILFKDGTRQDSMTSNPVAVTFTAKTAHEHKYSGVWSMNELSHWHQCTCGEHADEAFHSYEWTIVTVPTAEKDGEQKGVCTECGYETLQPIPAGSEVNIETPAKERNGHTTLYIILGAVALGVIGGAVFLIRRVLKSEDE